MAENDKEKPFASAQVRPDPIQELYASARSGQTLPTPLVITIPESLGGSNSNHNNGGNGSIANLVVISGLLIAAIALGLAAGTFFVDAKLEADVGKQVDEHLEPLTNRIDELQREIQALEREVQTLSGSLSNP